MTFAISKAVEEGSKAVICASTGNTSASAAAYAARAGLLCAVLLPAGHIALGKLAQALVHGAKVIPVNGNFDQALDHRPGAGRPRDRDAGQLGEPAPHRGPEDGRLRDRGRVGRRPPRALHPGGQRRQHHRLLEGLPARTSPPVGPATTAPHAGLAGRRGGPSGRGEPVAHPETIATAIRIGNPAELGRRHRRPGRVGRGHRGGDRRGDPRRLPAPGHAGGRLRASPPRPPRWPACCGPWTRGWWNGARRWSAP